MKRVLLSLSACLAASFAQAQYTANDSVVMSAGYVNDVFYSFANKTVSTVANTNWHLAFSVQPSAHPYNPETGASIRVNGNAAGLMLKKLPATETYSNWRNIDTTGLDKLPELINADTSWDIGAFNVGYDKVASPFDFMWGAYNQSTFSVEGTHIYVLMNKTAGLYKKIFINKLDYDTAWRFVVANLDNTDSFSTVIRKKQYPNRLFAYYNAVTGTVIDREPAKTDWDVLFTRYKVTLPSGPSTFTNYVVTGALSNKGVTVAEVKGKPSDQVWGNITEPYSKITSEIGWDWKTAGPVLEVYDSLTYFVKTAAGTTYKLVFTKVVGASAGKIWFFQDNKAGIKTPVAGILKLYPNPAVQQLNIAEQSGDLTITGIDGKTVFHSSNAENSVSVENLEPGIYTVRMLTAKGIYTGTFIKQ